MRERRARSPRLPRLLRLPAFAAGRGAEAALELPEVEGLLDHRTAQGAPHPVAMVGVGQLAGDEGHALGESGMRFLDPAQELEPALRAEPHVEEQRIRFVLGEQGLCSGDGVRQVNRVSAAPEPPGHRTADRLLIVDVEQRRHGTPASRTQTGVPASGRGRWYAFVRPIANVMARTLPLPVRCPAS